MKKKLIWLAFVIVVLLVFIFSYIACNGSGVTASENKYNDSQGNVDDDAISTSVQEYINYYLQKEGKGNAVSDEMLEQIVVEVTSSVLNSLPQTLQNDSETIEYVREMISDAVEKEVANYNETYNSNAQEYEALIKKIEKQIETIEKDDTNYDEEITSLMENFKTLETSLTNYKTHTSTQITTYETELETTKALIEANKALSDEQKAELENKIAAADISAEQKQALLDEIAKSYADATADTMVKVGDAKAALQAEIDTKTSALTNTVETLQAQIDELRMELDGCTIVYNPEDGHFYVTNSEGTVSKKLDFAQ